MAPEKLALSIKARIAVYVHSILGFSGRVIYGFCSLKTTYQRFRRELGDTGHGLIESNREGEIMAGTAIYNIWRTFTDILDRIY